MYTGWQRLKLFTVHAPCWLDVEQWGICVNHKVWEEKMRLSALIYIGVSSDTLLHSTFYSLTAKKCIRKTGHAVVICPLTKYMFINHSALGDTWSLILMHVKTHCSILARAKELFCCWWQNKGIKKGLSTNKNWVYSFLRSDLVPDLWWSTHFCCSS